jgi:hypothetical protein
MDLVRHAQEDDEFRRHALEDPEAALSQRGYELQPDEMDAVHQLHSRLAGMDHEAAKHALTSATSEGMG